MQFKVIVQVSKEIIYFCDTITPFSTRVLPPAATILYTCCGPPADSVLYHTVKFL